MLATFPLVGHRPAKSKPDWKLKRRTVCSASYAPTLVRTLVMVPIASRPRGIRLIVENSATSTPMHKPMKVAGPQA
jgi:hypothetical protein